MNHKYFIKKNSKKNKNTRKYKSKDFIPIKHEQGKNIIDYKPSIEEEKNKKLIINRNKTIKQKDINQKVQYEIIDSNKEDINSVKINNSISELNNKLLQIIAVQDEQKSVFIQEINTIKNRLDQIENLLYTYKIP